MAASGIYRTVETGVNPAEWLPTDADGALDAAGDPGAPIRTDFEGPWGTPWFEGLEVPEAIHGVPTSPNPTYPEEDVGANPIVGIYEPAVRTRGPVQQWSHEPSGGPEGDQALGRMLRFPANIPERHDVNGVIQPSYADELAAAIAYNGQGEVTEAQWTTELLLLPNVRRF